MNVARLRAPLDAPGMRAFDAALEPMNRLAARALGFLWRHEGADRSGLHVFDDGMLMITLSVWQSYPALHDFIYRTAHGRLVRRRVEWFARTDGPKTALWWVRAGDRPAIEEAEQRFRRLRALGSTPLGFSLLRQFDEAGRRLRAGCRSPR